MKKLIVLLPSACLMLVSCAGVPPYVAPSSGPMAHLTFRTESGGINLGLMWYGGRPTSNCTCSEQPGLVIGVLHNMMIGASGYADKGKNSDSFEVDVPASGNEFRFSMPVINYYGQSGSSQTAKTCQVHEAFVPEPHKNYELTYNFNTDPCMFEINEVTNDGLKMPVKVRNYPPCTQSKDAHDRVVRYIKDFCAANPELYQ